MNNKKKQTIMKNNSLQKNTLLFIVFLISISSVAQNFVPFTPRYDEDIKGDIVLIGNNILGPDNNAFNNNGAYNHNEDMQYIDIDGDPSTFSSSSADLEIPNADCYVIKYAGLYWGAVTEGTQPFTEVRLKGPTGNYNDITGTVLFDANGISVDGGNSFPYSCYADVTPIVTNLATDLGTYTVANVSSATGETSNFDPYNGTGYSSGWSLFIVYEDPTLPGKSITSFDGFSAIRVAGGNESVDVPISGFRTIPAPAPVRSNFAFAALEGDKPILGDRLKINGSTISSVDRGDENFFNSTVTQLSALPVVNRNPNSTNTLGFDTGVLNVPNPGNTVIANDATNAVVTLETSGDTYFPYFFALAVEIIEPKIVLTKIVEDEFGNNIGDLVVSLGQELNYIIGFQNTGNDDATNFTIRDILPVNIIFDYPTNLTLPAGVTVASYDITTREIIFEIENYLVEINDPVYEIRIQAQVVESCGDLEDACSNVITNQAYATYQGTLNENFIITDEPSFDENVGCLLNTQATNFLADLNCDFTQEIVLCGDEVTLTAANGYDTYSWSTDISGVPVIGTTQSIVVTATGTYYSFNTAITPCQSIVQIYNVALYGGTITNPVIPFADEVVSCPNDGKLLPNIFLCGIEDFTEITTDIDGSTSVIWEQLDVSSCPSVPNIDCANENGTCTWNQVATGPNYTANTSGQFRVTINYEGGCFNQFYFNVYQNLLNPTVSVIDILCETPGRITVNNVPSGYEYSLDNVNYQASNIFPITVPGIYTVYIRQLGVPNTACIFTVPDVLVRERDFTISVIVTQPLCNGDKGSIYLAANDAEPQYSFSIFLGGILVNSVGPIVPNNYAFENLNPGTYTGVVETEDGCLETEEIIITEPLVLTATASITRPLTCTDGEITVFPLGGTPPYFYFVNSTSIFQTNPEIVVTTAGVYNITVVDSNNCTAQTSITIEAILAPEFTVSQTDVLCYNDTTGEIEFNVTNPNGNSLEYSINGGFSFFNSPLFTGLSAGVYTTIVSYISGTSVCLTTPQIITIGGPDAALTATAGVSELAGCRPFGQGRIRITNPQGGTPFPPPNLYEYSFDNQTTWTTSNEASVSPGTYTVYIRDANGCVYAMEDLILEQEPLDPTIEISEPDFNCDGSGNATVTVTNNGGAAFEYNYYLDGVLNPNILDPQTFLNVPEGSHIITVEYTLLTVPTFSNLLYETFGYGEDTTSPGINPFYYCFERQVVATQCRNNPAINDGDYSITSNIEFPFGAWINPTDYTPPTTPATVDGRYMVVNIGATIPASEILYEKVINDIIPNQPIQVEFAAMNLLQIGNNQFDPNLRVALIDAGGTEISFFDTGNIPKTENWIAYPTTPTTLDPGANTSLRFILRSNVQQTSGNDVAIDDIKVYQLPIICSTAVEFPFIIPSGNAFTAAITTSSMASCSGEVDGTITIAAQNFDPALGFQYSIDNGISWTTQLTSPYTITGLAAGTYDVQIRYEDAPDTCLFSFSVTITAPDPLNINVSNTDVTCLNGATLTATATGGTPNYTFQLIDTAPPFTVTIFPGSGILTDVAAGTYTVVVTDTNGCTGTTSVILNGPTAPTAVISTTSDFCYDGTNAATLEVTASGGVLPYEYSLNGGPFQSSNIFSGLMPGTYTITVRDAFGCEITLAAQTIAPELIVDAVLTKDLDCTASPDAIITGTISGGTAPFSYAVSFNAAAFTPLGVTGTAFSFSTAIPGTYQFEITDDIGCTATTAIITINPITPPTIDLVTQTQDILCNGDTNGAIDITIDPTVGTPPFLINVNNDTTGTDYGTQTAGLPAGTYTITITDANSCEASDMITISEPDLIIVDFDSIDITCSPTGVSQGSIIINSVTGGIPSYNYFVTSTNGYSNSELNTSGSTSVSFNVVDFGLYEINVVDSNGCSVLIQDILVASPPSDLNITIDSTVDCTLGGQAVVSVSSSLGSAGPFWFSIYQGPISVYPNPPGSWIPENPLGSQSTIFTNLTPGVLYTFVVFDVSTNCSYYELAPAPIPTNSILTVTAVSSDNITCTGSDDGDVSFTVNNNYAVPVTVDYEIFDSLSLITTGITGIGVIPAGAALIVDDLGPLPFGDYFVLIEETVGPNAGCGVVTAPFSITESAFLLSLTTSVDQNANCNPDSGVVSAVAQNGTVPYQYQLTTTAAPPAATDPLWNTTSVFNVNAGNYFVHAIDAYGCIVSSVVQVVPLDDAPVIAITLTNECTAVEGAYDIEVSLTTAGTPPYSFSIDGGAFQTQVPTFTISNLSSGTHTVEVNDFNGCGNLETITILPPLAITPTITVLPSCLDNDGQIEVNATGGSGVYTYTIAPNDPSITLAGNIFSGVPSGTFTITITDTVTTCTQDAMVTVESPTPVSFTTQTTPVSCNGDSDGTITVVLDLGNNNPIYTYEIIAPIIIATQTSNVFTGLAANTYRVRVTSGRNCEEEMDVIIGEPDVIIVAAPAIVQYRCDAGTNSNNFATITVSGVTGGSGTYINYEFIKDGIVVQFGSDTTYTEADFSGGNYVINVYDDNGCIGTTTAVITINPFIALEDIIVTVDNAITCTNLEDVTVTVASTGGTPTNLQFTIEDIDGTTIGAVYSQTNATGIFTGLAIGNYIVTVENLDTGCILETVHFVNDPNTFDILIDTVIDVTCFNDADGSVNITFIDLVVTPSDPDQSGPFNYTINDASGTTVATGTTINAGPVTITGLAGDTYTIMATLVNTPFCTVTKNFTITRPTALLSLIALETSSVSCDDNQGTITAIGSGGWGNLEYELTGAATVAYSSSGIFFGLSAGNYTVNVRDSQGCIATENVVLTIPDPITANFIADASLLLCFGDQTATITVLNVVGGQGTNFTYTLNSIIPIAADSGPQTSNVFEGIGAGTYTVTITDGLECVFTSPTPIIIDQPDPIVADLIALNTGTCLTNPSLILSAIGGTGIYEYSLNENFNPVIGTFTTSVTINVTNGTFSYFVRDANGCISNISNEITFDPLPELEILLASENPEINCVGDNTGTIEATALGGLGNYVYVLQDAAGNVIPATQNDPGIFTELVAGTYRVLVTSGDCEEISEEIEITQPDTALEASFVFENISCFGADDGSLTILATGGTGIIKYAISPQLNQFFDINIFENLEPGIYDAIVQDELGCFVTFSFEITEPDQVIVGLIQDSTSPVICEGDANGAFSIEIEGGTPPYSVSINDYNGPYIPGDINQTDFSFSNLGGGDHTVYVKDSNGCESEWLINFPDAVFINPIVIVEYECVDNQTIAIVTVNVDQSVDPLLLTYTLNQGVAQQSNVFTNLTAGANYFITVAHTNGCIVMTDFFDIQEVQGLTLVLNNDELNQIEAIVTGGTGIYQFTVNDFDNGTNNIYEITETGEYVVIVTDSSGCTATARMSLELIEICIPNYFSPNGDSVMDFWSPGCIENYPNLMFSIFDRYGRKVALLRAGDKWDGRYNGNELPTGDYWFVIQTGRSNEKEFVGNFTLYR